MGRRWRASGHPRRAARRCGRARRRRSGPGAARTRPSRRAVDPVPRASVACAATDSRSRSSGAGPGAARSSAPSPWPCRPPPTIPSPSLERRPVRGDRGRAGSAPSAAAGSGTWGSGSERGSRPCPRRPLARCPCRRSPGRSTTTCCGSTRRGAGGSRRCGRRPRRRGSRRGWSGSDGERRSRLPRAGYRCGPFSSRPDGAAHAEAVRWCKRWIAAGDLYQANLCLRLEADFEGSPLDLFADAAARLEPARAAYLEGPWGAVASLSPELFLSRRGDSVRSLPIKGTSPRSADPVVAERQRRALERSAKDAAENVMIVDLMRNDLGRVCAYGTVHGRRSPARSPTRACGTSSRMSGAR